MASEPERIEEVRKYIEATITEIDSHTEDMEKPIEGRVKAVGKGKVGDDGKLVKLEVKIGDKVLYSKYGGTEIKFNGEDYLLMREDDVLAIVG